MREVEYRPIHGSAEPVQIAGVELSPGVPFPVTDDQAQALFLNRNIVDADTGKNPNFVCVICGDDTSEDAVFDPVLARTYRSPLVSLVDENNQRRCSKCLGVEKKVPEPPSPVISVLHEDDED